MAAAVAIRGAGPVGCALALLLHAEGTPVALLGERKAPGAAFRPIALSHASRLILERVDAWNGLAPTPIERIHVSQQGGFGRTLLQAADADVPALGYVTDYATLLGALLARVEASGITSQLPGEPALTVHAEGIAGDAEETDYRQTALMAMVATRPAASHTAWERFTSDGPLALLPYGGRLCVVWGMRPERAGALRDAPEGEFLAALAAAIGRRAGEFAGCSDRQCAPLVLRVRRSRVAAREAYVGNAAQTLHPVAGQGLNLGLRDAWDLAQAVQGAPDPGAPELLQRFASLRRIDAAAMVRITDFLAGAFLGNEPLGALMRGFGLTALDICLPARRFFARRMIYGASALP